MIKNGMLKALFNKYHRDKLNNANLSNRIIFHSQNNGLPELTPLTRKELWFEFDSTN